MSETTVLVLATLETKSAETDFLTARLREHGVTVKLVDTSLSSNGVVLDGPAKLAAMNQTITHRLEDTALALEQGANVVLGLGGGTGGEIALRLMRALPITFPKVLVTTLPFDPRIAVADSSIVLVPTLADISGLNATLREVLENAAALTAGLCSTRRKANACVAEPSIAITGLGATEGAVTSLVKALDAKAEESTVFHSNGYGGAAFTRFAERGAFKAIVDLTPHEATRIHVAGAHVPMPNRFSAGASLPRILLPGGLNFIGLGEKSLVPARFLERAHYSHSGFFTHAKMTADELRLVAKILAESLNNAAGPSGLVVPMGGFSHQDCPGGSIEDPALRQVFLTTMSAELAPKVRIQTVDAHISDHKTTNAILEMLEAFGAT